MKTAIAFLALTATAFAAEQQQTELYWIAGQIEGSIQHCENFLYDTLPADHGIVNIPLHKHLADRALAADAEQIDVDRLAAFRDHLEAVTLQRHPEFVPLATEF